MNIEELENELKNIKSFAYDLDREYEKLNQKIDEIVKEIKKLKESTKEEEIQNQSVVEIPLSEINENVISEEPVVNQENVEIDQNPQEIVPTSEVENTINLEEATKEPVQEENNSQTVITPIVQPEIENVGVEVTPGPQELDKTPLSPVGVEIPDYDKKEIYTKIDSNGSKALMTTAIQSEKLRKSKDQQKSMIKGEDTEIIQPQAVQQEELPKVDDNTIVTPTSVEAKKKELEDIFEELRTTTNENRANELQNQAKVLTKEIEEAA